MEKLIDYQTKTKMKLTIDSMLNGINKLRIGIELENNNYTKAEEIAENNNLMGYLLDAYNKQKKYILGLDLANRKNLEKEKEFFSRKIQ